MGGGQWGFEEAARSDLSLLKETLVANPYDASANVEGLAPHDGVMGIFGRSLGMGADGTLQWVEAYQTSDRQVPSSLITVLSDAQTSAIRIDRDVLDALTATWPSLLPASLRELGGGLDLHFGGADDLEEDFAEVLAAVERYSEDHPTETVAQFVKSRDVSQVSAFDVSLGLDAQLGLGAEIEVGFSGQAGKGYRHVEQIGEVVGGDLRITDVYTGSGEDSRDMVGICNDILDPLPGLALSELRSLMGRIWGTVTSTVDDLVVEDSTVTGSLIARAGKWLVGSLFEFVEYEPAIETATADGTTSLRPYTHTTARLAGDAANTVVFSTVVAAGEVRVVSAEDPSSDPIDSWATGSVTLQVPVTTGDLTERGVDPSLLDQVRIFRHDADNRTFEVVATTNPSAGVYECDVTQPGEYMPAIATDILDATGPEVTDLVPGDGDSISPAAEISCTVRDTPTGLNVGLDVASVTMLLDDDPVTATVTPLDESSATLTYRPDGGLALGAHTLQIEAKDLVGHATSSAVINFDVATQPPLLDWTGAPGYEADACDPEEGQYPGTMFTFKMLYADAEGDWPTTAKIELWRDRGKGLKSWDDKNLNRRSGSPSTGAIYAYRRRLPPGDWRYRFIVSDGDGTATGEPCEWMDGPSVLPVLNQRPDGAIWNDDKWVGDNYYNTTAGKQRVNRDISAGGTVDYTVRLQNDGQSADTLKVKGTAGRRDWTITYLLKSDGTDITSDVTGDGWITPEVAGRSSIEMTLRVAVDSGADAGAEKSIDVQVGRKAWSTEIKPGDPGDPPESKYDRSADKVRTVTTVEAIPEPTGRLAIMGTDDELYTVNPDGSDLTQLTDQPDSYKVDPGWSPDGQSIAFSSSSDGWRTFAIWRMQAQPGAQATLVADLDGTRCLQPVWCPTRDMIVFSTTAPSDLWLVGADGSNAPVCLTDWTSDSVWDADWSPDGTQLVFRRMPRGGFAAICVADVDFEGETLANPRTVVSADLNYSPRWSPDGTRIAFTGQRDGDYAVYVVNADGTGETNLTPSSSTPCTGPRWSPDGRWIAFLNKANVMLVDTVNPGAPWQQVTGSARGLDWSPQESSSRAVGNMDDATGPLVESLVALGTATGAQVTFSLSAAATVDARIMNIAGRPVKTICRGMDGDAGTNTLLWNKQADSGLRVPHGVYLVEVTARSQTGGQSRALTTVRIDR